MLRVLYARLLSRPCTGLSTTSGRRLHSTVTVPNRATGFLSEKIAEWDYRRRGVAMEPDEIFVGDGAKSDIGNIGDIFAADAVVAVTDPVYPVYVDTNVMAGRAGRCQADGRWSRIIYLPCTADNGFVPSLPESTPDIIYLCYPNNPTGTTLTRDQLATWVAYAQEHGAVILFDSAYEAFVTDADVPHSIYEIPGAREVAIEFRSFSKTAGFTGLRCGYTVIPKELYGTGSDGRKVSLNALWRRPAMHQVQWRELSGTAWSRSCLHREGPGSDRRDHPLLSR